MGKNTWLAMYIGAGIAGTVGLYSIISGSYLMAMLGLGCAGLLYVMGGQEKKKAARIQYVEDNPHTASTPVLYDENILEKLKEDAQYDPLDIRPGDLQEGWMLEHDLENWTVEEVHLDYYKEGANAQTLTKRVKLSNGGKTKYMTARKIHADQRYPFTEKVSVYQIDANMDSYWNKTSFNPPVVMSYQGEEYYREPASSGIQVNPKTKGFQQVTFYEYFNKSKTQVIQLQYLDYKTVEAHVGGLIDNREIGGILPNSEERGSAV